MDWQTFAKKLFPKGFDIQEHDNVILGTANVEDQVVSVIGTTNHVYITIERALVQSKAVLRTMHEHPKRPIILLIDTEGQNLALRDEMLWLNSAMAHLGKCIDLAKRKGHLVIGIVYSQALSGGFITTGLLANACYALKETSIKVMGRSAMARITKIPEEKLISLEKENPLFGTSPDQYYQIGALDEVWEDNLAEKLAQALRKVNFIDHRSLKGLERGGRKMAYPVAQAIVNET